MPREFDSLDTLFNHGFDTVIDVRSPAEFAEDHLPGATNLPALDNEQRAEVGTIYKQISPFDARKLGAAMVIQNIADHLRGPLAEKDGGWRPLVYCWRGGQRSGVFAKLLREIGWRAEAIEGGYQTYRRLVHQRLYKDVLPHQLILLDGYTGTAKTALLPMLAERGVQVLDLEGLACHRGSLLGALPGGQPSQRAFETRIARALQRLDPTLPVVIEAESSKIGRRTLPPSLWRAMCAAPRIVMDVPLAARASYLARAYAEVIADPDLIAQRLAPLRRLRGHAVVDHWITLSRQGALEDLSLALMVDHYDPAYAKSRSSGERPSLAVVGADALDQDGLARAADAVVAAIRR